jgi:hypothetical protein
MGTFGINVNRKPANLGGLSTQPLPLIANVTAATIVSNNGVATNQNTDQTNSLLLSAMPPIIVNQAMIPIIQASLPNAVSLSSNNSDISRAAQINQQNPTIRRDAAFSNVNVNVANATGTDQRPILSFPEMIDPMLATKPRDKRPLIFHFPPKTSVNINKVLPPSADTLRLGEIKIENNTFKPISKNGISVFRPEILGMVNFNPIFWPENKNEFTDAGRFLSINYQSQVLRRSTLDKIIEKIKASNDRQLVQSLSDSQNITSETVKEHFEDVDYPDVTILRVIRCSNSTQLERIIKRKWETSHITWNNKSEIYATASNMTMDDLVNALNEYIINDSTRANKLLLEHQLSEKTNELQEKIEKITDMQNELNVQQELIQTLTDDNNKKDKEITRLKKLLAKK